VAIDLRSTLRPVDPAVFLADPARVGRSGGVLGSEARVALLEQLEGGGRGVAAECTQPLEELAGVLASSDRRADLAEDVAFVEREDHALDRDPRLRVVREDRRLDRRSAAVARQERCMDVQGAVGRELEHVAAQDLAVARDEEDVRREALELRDERRILGRLRLEHPDAALPRELDERRRAHREPASARSIRARHERDHFVAAVEELPEYGRRERRGSEEGDAHPLAAKLRGAGRPPP
jgi:hypothetical protein